MSDLVKEVLPVFLGELTEQLARMSDALLKLEGGALDPTTFQGFLRDAHSIKGTAATFDFHEISKVAHAIEEVLEPVKSGSAALAAATVDLLLDALDAIKGRADAIQKDPDSAAGSDRLDEVLKLLRAAPAGGAVASPTAVPEDKPHTPAKPSSPEAAAPQAAAAEAVDGTMRVSFRALQELEARVELLRQVRGRLIAQALASEEGVLRLESLCHESTDPRAHDALRAFTALRRRMGEEEGRLGSHVRDLDDRLRLAQRVPIAALLESLRPAVMVHARKVGKHVLLEFRDGGLQIDRRVFEAIKDPLVHLLRNAVDHGLETPDERKATGKGEAGLIVIRASQDRESLRLEVVDDGRGIDELRLREKAVQRGLLSAGEAQALTPEEARALIFRPGFSTAAEITETSGRGVGLDVVANTVNRIHGSVEVTSEPGHGASFALVLPRATSAEQVFLVRVNGRRLALRMSVVERVARVPASAVERVMGALVLKLDQEQLRLISLGDVLGLREIDAERGTFPVIVLRSSGGSRVAVRCERIEGVREATVRPLPRELLDLRHLSGAADLGDGQVVFILDESSVFQDGKAAADGAAEVVGSTILVVDDTLTTRALHRRVLEAAGFRVLAAANGEEALRVLESQAVQLVVTDLEMPQLDGVGLLERMRATNRLAHLPAVLVSSVAPTSRKGRKASDGLADAYIKKADYDRGVLIDTVKRLLRTGR